MTFLNPRSSEFLAMATQRSFSNAAERIKTIKAVFLDVDGVMTDGGLFYGERGESLKRFHVHDGQGIQSMRGQGLQVGIISGRSHPSVSLRAQELGVDPVFQGIGNKLECLQTWLDRVGYDLANIAFMGDDLADVPVLKAVGFAASVPNAVRQAQQASHWISERPGGQGAVRCLADLFRQYGP
jgi:3-deoxy-D-manno-octulosonate 8-phosphate phosphatase (KDO 8-P phosphatase)